MGELTCVFGGRKSQTHENRQKSACGMTFVGLWRGGGAGHPGGTHEKDREAAAQLEQIGNLFSPLINLVAPLSWPYSGWDFCAAGQAWS